MSLKKLFFHPLCHLAVYILIAIFVAIQAYNSSAYNNFTIFQHAVYHFFAHQNPYLEYPKAYLDLFLYNPSFCIFFIPFAYLPTYTGLILWVVFISVVYWAAVWSLPVAEKSKVFIIYLVLPDFITSIQYIQTNTLLAAFILLAFSFLERAHFFKAAIFPPLGFFLKGYGGVSGVFFLLKKPSIKSFSFLAIWGVIIGGLPLLFYSWADFVLVYQQWIESLVKDYKVNTGTSVMGLIQKTVYADVPVKWIQLTGVVCFLGSVIILLITQKYEQVKYDFLAYTMIWVVIFNQASESATIIIASTGGFMWFIKTQMTRLNIALFVLFMLMTVMASSDIFGPYYRSFVFHYTLKILPCLLIWLRIQYTIIRTLRKIREI